MGLQLTSTAAVVRAIDGARAISLTAYTLDPREHGAGSLIGALERAADRGAQVWVRVEGAPYDPGGRAELAASNAAAVDALVAHGADAALSVGAPRASLHMKAAVVDGQVFLDDRNWPQHGPNTVVSTTDVGDVAVMRGALAGERAANQHLATWKGQAIQLELDVIAAGAGDAISCETESFGSGPLASALEQRARTGTHVRLLVAARDLRANARESAELRRMAQAGVQVRIESGGQGDSDEKFCVASGNAWIGSANATGAFPDTVDWGVRTKDAAIATALRARFDQAWSAALPCRWPP